MCVIITDPFPEDGVTGLFVAIQRSAGRALTRLLSYSFLEAAKSCALEMAIPQKGRYICSTCEHTKLVETILSPAIFKSGTGD